MSPAFWTPSSTTRGKFCRVWRPGRSKSTTPALLFEMRRSSAPSSLFKRAKLSASEDACAEPTAEKLKSLNHLQRFDLELLKPPKVAEIQDSSPDKENETVLKTNYSVYPNGKPLCFAISFVNTNRTAKKDVSGDGTRLSSTFFGETRFSSVLFLTFARCYFVVRMPDAIL